MSTTRQPTERAPAGTAATRRAVRQTLLLMVATAVLAVSAVALGTLLDQDTDTAYPAGTVRAFLVTAAVDHNGVVACRYLTPHALRQLQRALPPDTSCEAALSFQRLRLGGRLIDQESDVKGLAYRVEQRGGRARVTVSVDGAARSFELRTATATERDEFQPPPTQWRIDSGVEGLAGW
jgi:hypothetical protein